MHYMKAKHYTSIMSDNPLRLCHSVAVMSDCIFCYLTALCIILVFYKKLSFEPPIKCCAFFVSKGCILRFPSHRFYDLLDRNTVWVAYFDPLSLVVENRTTSCPKCRVSQIIVSFIGNEYDIFEFID